MTDYSDYPEGCFSWMSEDEIETMLAQIERRLRDDDDDFYSPVAACNGLWLALNFIWKSESDYTLDDRLYNLFWHVRDIVIFALDEDDIPEPIRERMEQWVGFMHKVIPELWPERHRALGEEARKFDEERQALREAAYQKEVDEAASAVIASSKGEASA